MQQQNYLTIDVEDYFQVHAFSSAISRDLWHSYPSRVVANTTQILEILAEKEIKATFFILGWTAEKHPEIVRKINRQGHEIGCHSYYHRLVYTLTQQEFREDTRVAKDLIEQITGKRIHGYRAPSYSITTESLWALDILEELGFTYDSSIFPIHHDIYGIPGAARFAYTLPGRPLKEYPISTAQIFGYRIPVAGGGYFRLFPYWFTTRMLKRINTIDRQPFIFYLHPWEIDPQQPRIRDAGRFSRFRHYNNLEKTATRFNSLLDTFSFRPIIGDTH